MDLPDPKPTVVASAYARPAGALLILAGVVHLIAPRISTRIVATGYDLVLDVDFEASDRTPRRMRAIGFLLVATGAHLLYHGGIVPGRGG